MWCLDELLKLPCTYMLLPRVLLLSLTLLSCVYLATQRSSRTAFLIQEICASPTLSSAFHECHSFSHASGAQRTGEWQAPPQTGHSCHLFQLAAW